MFFSRSSLCIADVFIGFHEDTIASIILNVCKDMGSTHDPSLVESKSIDEVEVVRPLSLLLILMTFVKRLGQILQYCKERLLLIATPDSILRLAHNSAIDPQEASKLWDVYFDKQPHVSLKAFLSKQLQEKTEPLFARVSNLDNINMHLR